MDPALFAPEEELPEPLPVFAGERELLPLVPRPLLLPELLEPEVPLDPWIPVPPAPLESTS